MPALSFPPVGSGLRTPGTDAAPGVWIPVTRVNVKAYRKLCEIQAALAEVTERPDALETKERDR